MELGTKAGAAGAMPDQRPQGLLTLLSASTSPLAELVLTPGDSRRGRMAVFAAASVALAGMMLARRGPPMVLEGRGLLRSVG